MRKNRFFLMFSVIGIAAITFVSCNRDQSSSNLGIEDAKVKAGRFDNKPFIWDVKTSNRSENETFLGDLNVQI